MLFSHFSIKGQSGWLHITFQKHGSFSWLVFQNLCTSVLEMQTPLALNQLSKSLLSTISMVVTDIQPPLSGMLDSPKIVSFPFLTWNMILKFPLLEGNIYGTPSLYHKVM